MKTLYKKRKGKAPAVLVGDLNVAPGEFDVWSHKQLAQRRQPHAGRNDRLNAVRDLGGFVDLARQHKPDPERALHLVELSQPRLDQEQSRPPPRSYLGHQRYRATSRAEAFHIHVPCRSWERPSDHVPVVVGLKL
jgi:exodeoxyribonuclease-3